MDIFGLKDALGGTLRQCLCVKESLDFDNTDFVDLNKATWWRYSSGPGYTYYREISNAKQGAKILCSKYKTTTISPNSSAFPDKAICTRSGDKFLFVRDDTYTTETAFLAAMKGVLLAYEKA